MPNIALEYGIMCRLKAACLCDLAGKGGGGGSENSINEENYWMSALGAGGGGIEGNGGWGNI